MASTEYSNILFGIIMNLSSCCDVFNMPHYYNRKQNDLMIGIGLSYSMYSTYSCYIFCLKRLFKY